MSTTTATPDLFEPARRGIARLFVGSPAGAARPVRWPQTTLGGLQYWGDRYLLGRCRVQQHVWDRDGRRLRVLDGSNRCLFRGDLTACRNWLHRPGARFAGRKAILPDERDAVLLVHGWIDNRYSFAGHLRPLRRAGFVPYTLEYPSLFCPLREHARRVHDVLVNLCERHPRVHLVGYSMGSIVLRVMLHEFGNGGVGRVVQIGPPNQGSQKATFFHQRTRLFRQFGGPAVVELADTGPQSVLHWLPAEAPGGVELGIVAGASTHGRGFSHILRGDDDHVVRLEETPLAGARDCVVLRGLPHAILSDAPAVVAHTRHFLHEGTFGATPDRVTV